MPITNNVRPATPEKRFEIRGLREIFLTSAEIFATSEEIFAILEK
jgi:hypothetical protein